MAEEFADQFGVKCHVGHVIPPVVTHHMSSQYHGVTPMSIICAISDDMNTGVTFGQWLKAQLRAKRWRQVDLASRIDVSRSTVGMWATDVQPPSEDNMHEIARVFGIRVEEVRARANRPARREGEVLRRLPGQPRSGPQIAWPVIGRIPADAVRWMQQDGELEPVQVPLDWIRGRSLRDVFAVEVAGNCLISHQIASGDVILCEWRGSRQPVNGDLVIVRIEDEVTCKLWYWVDGNIELRDGFDEVVWSGPPSGNVHVEGYAMHVIRTYGTRAS
jgi:SOS-response transcriptional repressor LexA